MVACSDMQNRCCSLNRTRKRTFIAEHAKYYCSPKLCSHSNTCLSFQDLVEKVMMLRKSIERLRNSEVAVQSPILAEKLTCYAGILAAEGSLATAMTYLPENSEQVRGIAVT